MSMTTKLPRLQLRAPLKAPLRLYHPSRHLKNLASPLSTSAQSQLNDIPPPASSGSSHSTVNEDEIAHFSRLSSLWWDERGEFGMLHKMNPVRMQFVREKLAEIAQDDAPPEAEIDSSKVLQGLNVLDVGCGGGLLSESLTRLGANTLGIDASSSNIAIASLHASQDPGLSFSSSSSDEGGPSSIIPGIRKGKGKLRYEHTSVESLLSHLGPSQFDVVCSMEVLEHVDHPRDFLNSCAQLVKPGGHLFLSTISRTPLSYFLTILSAEKILRLVEPGTHTYSKYITPSELISFFRNYPSPSPKPSPPPSVPDSEETSKTTKPWITTPPAPYTPLRTQAETRGIIYLPWNSEWVLAPRDGITKRFTEECNYLFWVRKPLE